LARRFIGPLLAICSIRRRNPEAPFAPEYVAPQLLLEWIRPDASMLGSVFLHKDHNKRPQSGGSSKLRLACAKKDRWPVTAPFLRDKVAVSAPVSWSLLAASDVTAGGRVHPPWEIPLTETASVRYGNSEFWKLEGKLTALGGMEVIGAAP
jgi:hypothetical protein